MQRILLIVLGLFLTQITFGQKGIITGKVTEDGTGEEIPFANITIKGTEIGAASDLTGVFEISLDAGTYVIQCSSLSFKDVEKEVIVKSGETTRVNFEISEDGVIIDTGAEVVARRKTNSANHIDNMKRKDGGVIDGVSSELAKALGASNVSAMASKGSGISVEGGKYVYVRGLSDRYSLTTMNGGEIPGLDPNRNSVQLDLFPSNLVQNITIRKSFTPNLPGSFTGGLIDIATKDFPDSMQYNVTFALGYNTNASLNSDFLSYAGSSTDVLGFDNGLRAIPSSVDGQNVPSFLSGENQALQNQTRSFSKTWAPTAKTALPNHKFGFSFGNRKTIKGGRVIGYNISTTYAHNYKFYEGGVTGRYKLTGNVQDDSVLNQESILRDARGDESVLWGALANLSYRYKKGNTIGLTVIRNQNGISSARSQQGKVPSIDQDFVKEQYSIRYLERSLNTAQLKGSHVLNEGTGVRVNWIASAARAAQETPDLRIVEFLIKNPQENSGFDLYDADINVPSRFFRSMNEWNFDTKADITIPFKLEGDRESNVQFGFSNVYKSRNFTERLYEFYSNGINFNGNVSEYFTDENMDHSQEDFIYVEDRTDTKNSYAATQNVLSGYAMTDFRITPLWRVVAGARVENAQIESISDKFYELESEEEKAKFVGLLDNTDILPSLNITRTVNEKTNLRLALTRTLARPSFREVSAFASFDFENQLVKLGNPNLKRTLIDNLDLRYEFYPEPGEIFSVSAFYKRFNNPIELVVNPEAANVELTWENQDLATLYGLEFEYKKNLDFIDALRNWKLQTNVTIVESQTQIDDEELIQIQETDPNHASTRRMFGQSPYIVNASLIHKNRDNGWSSAISYNVSGEKLVIVVNGGTPNVLEQPRHMLGVNVSKAVNENLKFTLSASNILNAEYLRTYSLQDQDYTFQSFRLGQTVTAKVSYIF